MKQFLIACALVAIALPVFAGNSTVVKVDDWSVSEPLVSFDLDGGVLTLNVMDRMKGGQIDESGTVLRALNYANPGLLQQMATEALRRADAQGIVSYPGDLSTLTQGQVDRLNEVLRRLIHDDLEPTMNTVKTVVSAETLVSIGSTLDATAITGFSCSASYTTPIPPSPTFWRSR